jgi:hypothetical protein
MSLDHASGGATHRRPQAHKAAKKSDKRRPRRDPAGCEHRQRAPGVFFGLRLTPVGKRPLVNGTKRPTENPAGRSVARIT